MRGDNTLLYVVVTIVILHFAVGIGYLIYKLAGPVKKSDKDIQSKTNNKEI